MDVSLVGNLTEAPEFAGDESKARASLTVAVSESYRTAEGTWQSGETMFWHCWAWGKRALAIRDAGWVKGTPVVVQGTLRANVWRDRDGQTHRRTVVDVRAAGLDITRPVPASVVQRRQETLGVGEDRTHAWDTPPAPTD